MVAIDSLLMMNTCQFNLLWLSINCNDLYDENNKNKVVHIVANSLRSSLNHSIYFSFQAAQLYPRVPDSILWLI